MEQAIKDLQAIQRKREIDTVVNGDYEDYSNSDVENN